MTVVLKNLFLKNTRICCLAVQAAPLSYLLRRIDPRLQHLLNREDVRKFFQEVDLNALLQSASKIILIIRESCSVLCLQVPADVWQLTNDKLISWISFLRRVLVSAVNDGAPWLASICARNRQLAIEFAHRLPGLTVSAAKRLVQLSAFLQRCSFYALKSLRMLKDFVSPQLISLLQSCWQNFATDEQVIRILKFTAQYVRESPPRLKLLAKGIISDASKIFVLLKTNLQYYLTTTDFKDVIQHYVTIIYRAIKDVVSLITSTYRYISPHMNRLVHSLFDGLAVTLRYIVQYVLPALNQYIRSSYGCTIKISKELKRFFQSLLAYAPSILEFIKRYLYPIADEIKNSVLQCSKEISSKSFQVFKTIFPSLFCASKAVTLQTTKALSEVGVSSKKTMVVISPVIVEAALFIHPQVSQSIMVVLSDGRTAIKEVASATLIRSKRSQVVIKGLYVNLPVVIRVVNRVSVVTVKASFEVSSTCYMAKSRVLDDVQKGKEIVKKSYLSAEEEIVKTVKEALIDDPDLLNLITKSKLDHSITKNVMRDKMMQLVKECTNLTLKFILTCTEILTHFWNSSSGDKHKNLLKHYIQKLITKLEIDIAPELWFFYKRLIQSWWQRFCNASSSSWKLSSVLVSEAWDMVCIQTPRTWQIFKDASRLTWTATCAMAPHGWEYVTYVTPTIWSSSRVVVKWLWIRSLSISDKVWNNVLVPATSATWTQAQAKLPVMWVVLCDTSRRNWIVLCTSAENSWMALKDVTETCWTLGEKVMSKVWNQGGKKVTKSAISTLGRSVRLYNTAGHVLSDVRFPTRVWGDWISSLKNSVEVLCQLPAATLEKVLNKMMEPFSDFDVGQELFTYH